MNKRDFIKTMGTASALALLHPLRATGLKSFGQSGKKVLILGGRGFLGPTIVQAFLNAGYEVTLLNRGKTNTHLFTDLPIIICDREKENKAGLLAIDKSYRERYWDIVVDTWQKSAKAVADFLDVFKGQFGHYHYVSTISVYDKWDKKFIVESEPLNPLPKFPKTISEEFRYAIRKTLAEEAVRARIDNFTFYRSHGMRGYRVTRPGRPNSEPFWPIRFQRGGEILLPNVKDHHMQATDVVSLANFIVHCSAVKNYGAYNVAYPSRPFKGYVACLISVTGAPDKLHWLDGDFLIENGLLPYKVIPFWRDRPAGAYYFNVQKALNDGLVNRPMVELISDQLAGYKSRYPKDDIRFGEEFNGELAKCYTPQREQELIKKWQDR